MRNKVKGNTHLNQCKGDKLWTYSTFRFLCLDWRVFGITGHHGDEPRNNTDDVRQVPLTDVISHERWDRSSFTYEHYPGFQRSFKKRKLLVKLWISTHRYEIERGHNGTKQDKENRLSRCSWNKHIEDKEHVLSTCPNYTESLKESEVYIGTNLVYSRKDSRAQKKLSRMMKWVNQH